MEPLLLVVPLQNRDWVMTPFPYESLLAALGSSYGEYGEKRSIACTCPIVLLAFDTVEADRLGPFRHALAGFKSQHLSGFNTTANQHAG